jgi:hypothetical protein
MRRVLANRAGYRSVTQLRWNSTSEVPQSEASEGTSFHETGLYAGLPVGQSVKPVYGEPLKREIPRELIEQIDNFTVSSLRADLTKHNPKEDPRVQVAAAEARTIDSQLDASVGEFQVLDPLRQFTSHFKYGNYRNGDEDAVLENPIDWEYYRSIIADTSVVDSLLESYKQATVAVARHITENGGGLSRELDTRTEFLADTVRKFHIFIFSSNKNNEKNANYFNFSTDSLENT